jgi:hypothetical protein
MPFMNLVIKCTASRVASVPNRDRVEVILEMVSSSEVSLLVEQILKQRGLEDKAASAILDYVGEAACLTYFKQKETAPAPPLMKTRNCNTCRHAGADNQGEPRGRVYVCRKYKHTYNENEVMTSTCSDWGER